MKIDDLSITELKAAYDFVKLDLKELKKKAKKEGVEPDTIAAYSEVKKMEDQLFHKLLNITRFLE
jgi:hypothetical protein